jgi:SAM-dependent methyltransferase
MTSEQDATSSNEADLEGVYDAEWVRGLVLAPDRVARYPRASKYDPKWIFDNQVGSQCLWLVESLAQAIRLQPSMRVLDLGCGTAIESIFLAREFGVQVWATDARVNPTENWKRICECGAADRVFPLQANALKLPYPDEFFDAIVSINALQFFGTDDLFLTNHLLRMVKPGGQIGIVVPGLVEEFEQVPAHLQPYWDPSFFAWHSAAWWRQHWDKTGLVDMQVADSFPDGEGYKIFATWEKVMRRKRRMVGEDAGRAITFIRMVAEKK